jgi:hypothetical protein
MLNRLAAGRAGARLATAGVLLAATLIPAALSAQSQRQLDVHGNYSRGTTSDANSWGAGTQVQLVWGASKAPVKLGTSLGGDFLRPQSGGPNQWSTSLDGVVQAGSGGTLTPYAGASVSATWSTGPGAMWSGARHGLETMAGVQVKLGAASDAPSLKLEERFGYIRGQEHSLSTHVGIVMSL